ncbi:MAG TPA: 3-deoxy-D-manno-octulosonic acid transferase [Vicinamibacterales bacterium]|jgi:3-deoxy-D-manno-octulosonic-acid transferase|nr:3-deoxy-D-manno-octulosonic acid transferase [Vicinamibacterales bacterium]
MYALYSVLIVTFFLIMSPYLAWQAVRYRKYIGSLRQRLGYLPISFNLDGEESIWIHAVSVGEVLTARAILPQLRERYPRLRLFLSTTTMTGQQIARNSLQYVDEVFYFPFDLGFIVNRTLRMVRPRLFIMMETEIWPNLLRACHRGGIRTVLVNGRISSRSYPRYRLARPFFRRVLAHVDRFCMQGEESARRIVEMGADPEKVLVTGSLKFDSLDLPGSPAAADRGRNRVLRYFRVANDRPVVIAASTLKGEEEPVLEAFQRIRARFPGALLIVAPRKPERFDEVEQLVRRGGWNVARRSELPVDSEPRQDVVVLDTIGELAQLYQVATAVFVGGSIVDQGGHNILEPAVFGKAIVFGPHMQNFAEIARAFVENDAAIQIRSGRDLEQALLGLLTDPVRRARLGAAARALVEANRGARGKTMTAIARALPPQEPGNVRPFRVVH